MAAASTGSMVRRGRLRSQGTIGIAVIIGMTAVLLAAPVRLSAAEASVGAENAARREAALRRYLADHPEEPAAYFALGDHLRHARRNPEEGMALLRTALRHHPPPALAEQIRASLVYWQEQREDMERIPELRRRAARSSRPDELVELGRELLLLGEAEQAKAVLLRAARSRSKRIVWRVFDVAAGWGMEGWEEEEAEAFLRSVAARWPGEPDAHRVLGTWLDQRDRDVEALVHYRRAIAAAVARSGQSDSETLYYLAALLERQGDLEGALAATRQRLAFRDPSFDEAGIRTDLGSLLSRLGRHREALDALRLAVAERPIVVEGWNELGRAFLRADRAAEACQAFQSAIAAQPLDAKSRFLLGTCLQAQGRYDEAIAIYRQALALDPADAAIAANLGRLLIGVSDREAEAHLRAAAALDPKFTFAAYFLAEVLERQGKAPEAIAAYRRARELDPYDAHTAAALGHLLIGVADREAEGHLRFAVDLDRESRFAHFYLGIVLQRRGQLEEAIEVFHRYTVLAPDNARGHLLLAGALGRQGRFVEAAGELVRAGDRYSVEVVREASKAMAGWVDD